MSELKCAVMQPTYLPWLGYFNLIINSDVFIFLDDVQYTKNSFCSRNRYPSSAQEGFNWLTIPVRRQNLTQTFIETKFVNETNWRKKQLTTLQTVYAKTSNFKSFFPVIEKVLIDESLENLADLNIACIKAICHYLGINKNFHRSSLLNITGERSERLLSFCSMFKCNIYLSPAGARTYIDEDRILPQSEVKVIYQDFKCKVYPQKGSKTFQPYMSIIDLLFNVSKEEALTIINEPIIE